MKHKEAESYAEALLFAKSAIENGVYAARANALAKHKENLGTAIKGGKLKDPTSEDVLKKLETIPVLRCMQDGKTFQVNYPEKWLEVFSKSFITFSERYGTKATEVMEMRYLKGSSVQAITEHFKITRRTYANYRLVFLAVVLIYAAQNGLIKIDVE